ncbi:hypothetical protein B0T16DRAFT_246751 [Cercophora newfieldiana]|uniref:Uncharacterized protein n=1 Tax=Cercophora newfieldiana TaxID=92897 RepID=A0AA39XT48_9PEZI|nr:hypothetical protein B0T16DRAFT_246751 [Cercophora newfieldiana]
MHLSPHDSSASPGTYTADALQGSASSVGSPAMPLGRGRNTQPSSHPNQKFSAALAPPVETVDHRSDTPSDAALAATGMEFVLALEAPCLGHIHNDPDNPDQPNGHALTTSSYVLAFSPLPPSPDPDSNAALLTESLDSAPRTILDRLVTLSTNFALEDEVTPVQAWSRIQGQLKLGAIGVEGIKALIGRLVAAVKCHGWVCA